MLHLFLLNFNPCPGFVVIFLNSKSVTEYTSDSKNCILSANLVNMFAVHSSQIIDKSTEQGTQSSASSNTSHQRGIVRLGVTQASGKAGLCPLLTLRP